MLELPPLVPPVSQSGFLFSDFHWSLDALVRDPLLITGDNRNLTLGAAVIPLLEQLVDRHAQGGILLSHDPVLPAALESAAWRAGRQGDVCIFRAIPKDQLPYAPRTARFNLLSCDAISPVDYARLLLEPTVGERIREGCLSLKEQGDLAVARGRAEAVLARGICLARKEAAATFRPIVVSDVTDALVRSGELDAQAHRVIYERFAPLLWDEPLAALFCGGQPNTVSIEEIVHGSKLVAFDLSPSYGGGEYAATVIKRLVIHSRSQAAYSQTVQEPLWLIAEADAAFLEWAELGLGPDGWRTLPVEAAMAVIVCATSPRLAAMGLRRSCEDEGLAAVAAIPNRIMFRPPRSEILIAQYSGEPDLAYVNIDGVDAALLSDMGERAAYCARRGEPARLIRLERLPGEGGSRHLPTGPSAWRRGRFRRGARLIGMHLESLRRSGR